LFKVIEIVYNVFIVLIKSGRLDECKGYFMDCKNMTLIMNECGQLSQTPLKQSNMALKKGLKRDLH
jgi:hypothetical protein